MNFDNEFDLISRSEFQASSDDDNNDIIIAVNSVNSVPSINENTERRIICSKQSDKTTNGSIDGENVQNITSIGVNEKKSAMCSTCERKINDVFNICSNMFGEFRKYAEESLVRIGFIEDAMIKNGFLASRTQKSKAAEMFENSRMFAVSNCLPIKNIDDFGRFEENLKNDEFRNTAVSWQWVNRNQIESVHDNN